MHSVREPQPHHVLVQRKLKASFGGIYMTALSVIQGVALADLALVVESNYQQFTLTQWLLVLVAFGVLISVWNIYTMLIMSLDWIPDLRDAVILFVLGALELVLNHLIPLSLGGWLLAMALLSGWGAVATWHNQRQAGQEAENLPLLTHMRRQGRWFIRAFFGISACLLLLAVASTVGHVQAVQQLDTARGVFALAIALLAVAFTSGVCLVSVWYWHGVVAYAQTEDLPGGGQQGREVGQSPGDQQVVRQRLKDQFTPVYLTALSVIQGVALADGAVVVGSEYQRFTLEHWLLVLVNFVVLITVWNLYMMHITLWNWLPDLRDAVALFVVGALELLLNHSIYLSLSLWLFALAALASMALFSIWYVRWRGKEEDENTRLLSLLGRHHHWFGLYCLAVTALQFLLALASRLGHPEASDGLQGGRGLLSLALVLLAAGCQVGFNIISIREWRYVASYARTGHLPI